MRSISKNVFQGQLILDSPARVEHSIENDACQENERAEEEEGHKPGSQGLTPGTSCVLEVPGVFVVCDEKRHKGGKEREQNSERKFNPQGHARFPRRSPLLIRRAAFGNLQHVLPKISRCKQVPWQESAAGNERRNDCTGNDRRHEGGILRLRDDPMTEAIEG